MFQSLLIAFVLAFCVFGFCTGWKIEDRTGSQRGDLWTRMIRVSIVAGFIAGSALALLPSPGNPFPPLAWIVMGTVFSPAIYAVFTALGVKCHNMYWRALRARALRARAAREYRWIR